MRINKYLQAAGICSRRQADDFIKRGLVFINGVPALCGTDVASGDIVVFNGRSIHLSDSKVYFALNKPFGYITSSKDQFGRKTVLDLVQSDIRIFAVGRLDFQTEGLIFLTNDGDFSYMLTHPRNKVEKTYFVRTNLAVTSDIIEHFAGGVLIDGVKTSPASVKLISEHEFLLTITEGRNRQVRKMCQALGLECIYLKRTAIGDVQLGDLPIGQYRHLTNEEIIRLSRIGKEDFVNANDK